MFVAFVTHEIMRNPLEDETPASRLKQLGMMVLLYTMHKSDIPLSFSKIGELTGISKPAAQASVDPLVKRGLLVQSWVPTSTGRGWACLFQIAPDVFKKLQAVHGS